MNIPKFSIENYQLTLTVFVALLVMGVLSFLGMPQREDPVVEIPNTVIVAVYPGANPEDMESQVVDIIEEAVNELEDIKEVRTTINDGVAAIAVESIFGLDSDDRYDEIVRQVNQIQDELPADLYQLDVRKISTSTVNIMQMALVSEKASYRRMKSEAERIKGIIEDVDGVKKVEIEAYPEEEIRIALNPILMTEMNISLDDIERSIQSSNANIPGGAVKVSNRLFNIKTSGAYQDLNEIKNTVVGSYQGKIIYLKNIAAVYFDYEDDRWLGRYNGEKAIYINTQQKDAYNIFDIANPIKEKVNNMSLAGDIRLEYVFDQSIGVKDRVSGFLSNLLQGIALVGVIIFLLLGARSSSIVMISIPLSILIGLWIVGSSGFALQQMSIAGLIVALGLLVDNSIAIIENIERFIGLGYTRKEAAIKATQQLIAPITSATLTTVLAFVPIIMMPETTGAFIKALPVTVIATLTASLIIAVTLTPYIASKVLKEGKTAGTRTTFTFKGIKRFVEGPYRKTLRWTLNHRFLTITLALASLMGALLLFPLVGVSFFPKAEKPQFRITINLPNGSNLDATDEAVRYVESVLDTIDAIDYYASNVGHGNPRIYYNINPVNYTSTYGELFVMLKTYDIDAFYRLLNQLRRSFSSYADARIDVKEFVQGPPSEAPIEIQVFGDDLLELQSYAREIENLVKAVPGAINVDNPLRNNSTDLYFKINRDKAMMLGVPIHVIDKSIRSFVNGATIGRYRDKNAEEYNIVMRYDFEDQFTLEDFNKLTVKSVAGHFIPLKQLADIEFSEAPSLISHFDSDRTATILADLDNAYTLDPVIADIEEHLNGMEWKEGYSYAFKGDLENRNSSFGGMGIASVMALLLIFGVLIVQFKSFVQPLIIFSALPLAIIGSILALYITGIPFSFTAFVGLTSLIGIAINNSIVLVDYANKLREEGKTVLEAAMQAGEVRFIPIVATTLTTILGLLPLTLTGGSLWAPMGWTIIGGLITSTTFVLLLVPVLYQLFTKESAITTVPAMA